MDSRCAAGLWTVSAWDVPNVHQLPGRQLRAWHQRQAQAYKEAFMELCQISCMKKSLLYVWHITEGRITLNNSTDRVKKETDTSDKIYTKYTHISSIIYSLSYIYTWNPKC